MKSIRITFRLKPHQLAHGLQTIRQLEPAYKLISLNDIVKTIYHDYLAKMSINRNESVPNELIEEIISATNKSTTKSLTLDDLLAIKQPTKDLPIELSEIQEPAKNETVKLNSQV